jgi:hypothetical protein
MITVAERVCADCSAGESGSSSAPVKNAPSIYSKLAGRTLHLLASFLKKVVDNSGDGAFLKESCGKLGVPLLSTSKRI